MLPECNKWLFQCGHNFADKSQGFSMYFIRPLRKCSWNTVWISPVALTSFNHLRQSMASNVPVLSHLSWATGETDGCRHHHHRHHHKCFFLSQSWTQKWVSLIDRIKGGNAKKCKTCIFKCRVYCRNKAFNCLSFESLENAWATNTHH